MTDDPLPSSADLYDAGRDYMQSGDYEDAVVLFEKSIALRPHFKTLELLGECYMRLGRLERAIVPLAAASTLNTGVRAPSLLADVFLKLGQLHDARELAKLALQRDPNNRRAMAVMAALGS
jgi:tetratricopeptide (TPR) repeat protein